VILRSFFMIEGMVSLILSTKTILIGPEIP